jgi:hypothetical protein
MEVLMATKRAFLHYLGDRKWRKQKNIETFSGKPFLMYIGNRKWRRK